MSGALKKIVRKFLGVMPMFALGAGLAGVAAASPIVNISIEARAAGTADPFSSIVQVVGGGTYDFRVLGSMASLGTHNSTGVGPTISTLAYNSHVTTGDGIANLKFDLFETAADLVQVNLTGPATLNPTPVTPTSAGDNVSWAGGTGASGGSATARAGGTGNDLVGIRPVHVVGVQTAVKVETLLSGQFTLSAIVPGQSSLLQGRWTTNGPGVVKINGGTSIPISTSSETGADPYVSFTPLVIATPEPVSLAFIALGSLVLLGRKRSC